jgi:predicted nucleic acid-binding protein
MNARTLQEIQSLALSHRLSAYDAAYVELASRKSLALATLDKRVVQALEEMGLAGC